MIKKLHQQETEVRKSMRGGPGEVKIRHYLKKEDVNFPCRLCAQLIISPGSGVGEHEHAGEDEIFIVEKGKGVIAEGGKEAEVEAGDAIVTGKGASHAVMNTGSEDLVITAIIVQYGA